MSLFSPAAHAQPTAPDSTASLLSEVALTLLPGIGPLVTRQLIGYLGSAQNVLNAGPNQLLKVPGVGPALVNVLRNSTAALRQAEQVLRRAEQDGARLLYYTRPDYPARLRPVPDAPVLLYYQGPAELNNARTLAVVGTRQATDYGREQTEKLIKGVAPYQPLVVSGLAYGIDIVAHRAALQEGLPTVAVMATGLDSIYPHAHRRTAEKMLEQGGGLLTEFTFGTPPDKYNFPARNRIIAGLTDATVVVEAAKKGGALITAELALDYNREVLAVPGRLDQPASEGCNQLIRNQQARIYTGPEDIEQALNWDAALQPAAVPAGLNPADFTPGEFALLEILQACKEKQIDELSWQAQLPINQVSTLLLGLEFRGVVRALPGKKFALV
ncbi:DNA-processing protein DprA [Hymenobacter sp. 15J16-1T3B]|uniref:DNA-processing protein DprA n=1 Tax=Hymenobacter sp. 15J16-1T3B TaxID=2886941 RepID=UPI001D1276EE|nr:DNA-processing protein DprA [Hymenobacter sp. 15J16-1T3B]MCC3158976.1 DNA-processing protein DprA [Hymenobacter sp. 15J16-1T3B]